MPEEEKTAPKGRVGGAREDKDALLRAFERKLIGVIRKQKGALSTKAQEEIRETVDEYVERWSA
jgi:hypothetical protein